MVLENGMSLDRAIFYFSLIQDDMFDEGIEHSDIVSFEQDEDGSTLLYLRNKKDYTSDVLEYRFIVSDKNVKIIRNNMGVIDEYLLSFLNIERSNSHLCGVKINSSSSYFYRFDRNPLECDDIYKVKITYFNDNLYKHNTERKK